MSDNRAIISLGSNVDHGDEMLRRAIADLGAMGCVAACAAIYSTPPVSGKGNDYFNTVAVLDTPLDYDILVSETKALEQRFGRDEESRRLSRVVVDLDVVMFNGEVMRPRDFRQTYFTIGYNQLGL